MLSVLVFTLAVFGYANAKFAFPVPSYFATEKAYRTVSENISWDPTNLLTDLAGPLALCDRLSDWGPAGKKSPIQAETVWNATRIDPVFFPPRDSYVVYYFILTATGADARAVHNDIKGNLDNLQRGGFQSPPYIDFQRDLQNTTRFGCSVEPQCASSGSAKTVVVCLFAQKYNPPPYYMQGFNETWKAHSHDPYASVAGATFPTDMEFPGYVFLEDELVVKELIGNDLCDKHVYNPPGFVDTIHAYWANPNRSPTFLYPITNNVYGWFLGTVSNPNATNLDFIVVGRDNTLPPQFRNNVMSKMFNKENYDRNAVLAKNPPVQLNTGACVMAVCPNRPLPRGGFMSNGVGKQAVRGNFIVAACMTFYSEQVIQDNA